MLLDFIELFLWLGFFVGVYFLAGAIVEYFNTDHLKLMFISALSGQHRFRVFYNDKTGEYETHIYRNEILIHTIINERYPDAKTDGYIWVLNAITGRDQSIDA